MVVSKPDKAVKAHNEHDELIAIYAATIGSAKRPAPSGKLDVEAVAENPSYYP